MNDTSLNTSADERAEVARLRAAYDSLLTDPAATPDEAALAELGAMARIFDLDADRAPGEVWRDLRAVLSRQARPGGDPGAAPEAPPLTVMLVEDDPVTAGDLSELLVAAGHRVVGPFTDAATAAAAAGLHVLDLALLDINLSGDARDEEGGGVALARTLTESWGVPIMFLSGDVSAAARHARLATALVLKPYGGRDVLNAINRAVASGAVAP